MLWWSAEVAVGWRNNFSVYCLGKANNYTLPFPCAFLSVLCSLGDRWCFSLLLTPALLWCMEKICQLFFPGWCFLHVKPCRWINRICLLPAVSPCVWSCWVLDVQEQQTPLPIIPWEGQRSAYQLVGCTSQIQPLSFPVSSRMSSKSPSLPVLLGLERFALQKSLKLLHPFLKLLLKLNSPADCSREPWQCQLHPLQNLQAMRKGREQAVKIPENTCKISVFFSYS